MNKRLAALLVTLTLAFNAFATTFDASSLTDNLSRSVSLQKLFFNRFTGYVNTLYFQNSDDEITPSIVDTSLDAIWYTGFDIDCGEFGVQEGALIKGYSDLYCGYNFGKVIAAFGAGGTRHGVYLTDITFNTPANDVIIPVVTDFVGEQLLNDIYAAVFGVDGIFWTSAYALTCQAYEPLPSGLLGKTKTSVGYFGLKTQAIGSIFTDLLFDSKFKLQSFDWAIDPYNLTVLCLGKALNMNISAQTGINWDSVGATAVGTMAEDKIDWKSFYWPLSYAQTIPLGSLDFIEGDNNLKFSFNGEAQLAFGEFKNIAGSIFSSAEAGVGAVLTRHLVTDKGTPYMEKFGANVAGSYYANKGLQYFGDSKSTNAIGLEAKLSYAMDYFVVEAVYRRNFASDLRDLLECKDKHVVGFNVRLQVPNETVFGPSASAEEVETTEDVDHSEEVIIEESLTEYEETEDSTIISVIE